VSTVREAVALYEKLASGGENLVQNRNMQALCHLLLGKVLADAARPSEAEPTMRHAVLMFDNLTKQFPAVPNVQSEYALALANLGEFLIAQKRDATEPRDLAERAIGHQKQALAANPRQPSYRERLRNHFRTLARIAIVQTDHAAAANAAKEMAAVFPENANDQYDAASLLSQVIPL
jgi:hypothetical protein